MSADKPRRAILTIAKPPAEAPARTVEPVIVNRLPHESAEHFSRRCASIAALGERWLGHPQYQFIPLHSVRSDIWLPAHRLWWERVHVAAAMDRAKNPAYRRAAGVRAALGD